MEAAAHFFAQARTVVGHAPETVTTDGRDAYPRAIRATLGLEVRHRASRYCHDRMERDHRGITQRYDSMRGFGSFEAAARFCTAHDEPRDHLRYRQHLNETVSLADQRRLFQEQWGEGCAMRRCTAPPAHPCSITVMLHGCAGGAVQRPQDGRHLTCAGPSGGWRPGGWRRPR